MRSTHLYLEHPLQHRLQEDFQQFQDIPSQQKLTRLFDCSRPDGVTALCLAAQNGHVDTN